MHFSRNGEKYEYKIWELSKLELIESKSDTVSNLVENSNKFNNHFLSLYEGLAGRNTKLSGESSY